jgi:uncharacterized Zn finger protein
VEKKQKSTEAEIMPDSSVTPIEDCLGNFWQAGEALDSFITNPALPEIEGAILKRLGKPPLAIGGENMTTLMTKAYAVASKAALRAALGKPASKKN